MVGGLFSISCPQCGSEIDLDATGHGACSTCRRSYLHRFGQLIPLDHPLAPQSSEAPRVVP
jgi:hypothetical protein